MLVLQTLAVGFMLGAGAPAAESPYGPVGSAEVWVQNHLGKVTMCGEHSDRLVTRLEGQSWMPGVGFRREGERGYLNIDDMANPAKSKWTVCFGDGAPLDLHVWLREAKGVLNLEKLDVNSLDLQLSKDAKVRIGGSRWRNSKVSIRAGRGNLDLRFDRRFGVRIIVYGGPGKVNIAGFHREGDVYVNYSYGRAPATIDTALVLSTGPVTIREL